MTNLTLEDVERVFAEVGCRSVAQLVRTLSKEPCERISLPLPIAYSCRAQAQRKYLYLNDILRPHELTAQRFNCRVTPVRTAAYLQMLLRTLSDSDLHAIDDRIATFETAQFLT